MYQGEKVILRALDNSDLMRSLDFSNDYDTMRGATSGLLLPSTVDDEARLFSAQSRQNRGEYQFAVETRDTHAFIGRCGFINVDWKNRSAEITVLIGDGALRGKGYGTDAVRTLLRFGFDEMNLHKASAQVFTFNEAALRCYEKCGFVREGLLREEVYRDGRYQDVAVLGLIRP